MVRPKLPVKPPVSPGFDMFLRLWDRQTMTPSVARHLLKLKFNPDDEVRMHTLAERNQEGMITPDELAELDRYIETGLVVSVLQSRARQFLKKTGSSANRG
jgi:hypothetical protein